MTLLKDSRFALLPMVLCKFQVLIWWNLQPSHSLRYNLLVIALSASLNWWMSQLDVKNAFLHGNLKETVNEATSWFCRSTQTWLCMLLHKSLYSLKQAPRAWFDCLSRFLLYIDFYCSKTDSSLFVYDHKSVTMLLLVYIGDILMTGNNDLFILNIIQQLSSKFAIKDLGSLSFFLGVKVEQLHWRSYFFSRHISRICLVALVWLVVLLMLLLWSSRTSTMTQTTNS